MFFWLAMLLKRAALLSPRFEGTAALNWQVKSGQESSGSLTQTPFCCPSAPIKWVQNLTGAPNGQDSGVKLALNCES